MRTRSPEVDGGPQLPPARFRARLRAGVWRVAGAVRSMLVELAGWLTLLGGLAAIPLPGPGLLITFVGLLLLARRHSWAERRVDMVRLRALKAAAQSVATWQRVAASSVGAVVVLAVGVAWIVSPPAPRWWPLAQMWWLPGGRVVGMTQMASAIIALCLLGYSYRAVHGAPERPAVMVGNVADRAAPSPPFVATCATVCPDCSMGECHEVLCGCLCTSAA